MFSDNLKCFRQVWVDIFTPDGITHLDRVPYIYSHFDNNDHSIDNVLGDKSYYIPYRRGIASLYPEHILDGEDVVWLRYHVTISLSKDNYTVVGTEVGVNGNRHGELLLLSDQCICISKPEHVNIDNAVYLY